MNSKHINFDKYLEEQLSDPMKKKHFDNQRAKLDDDFNRVLEKNLAQNKEVLKYLKNK
ncbi:hypothetical protein [Ligilactobacillus equi]|uniref:hypothetical protein n=1 Tax=Ligilactobacillus equi TaxID=137357 RepID=UPI000A3E0D1C|nr:hypothetical protein [Ligilactobacillus equi]